MKDEFNRYGKRLSEDEYIKKTVALQENLPAMPNKVQDEETRKAELNLSIDHKLGIDFPQEKRDQMWLVAQEIESERLRIPFLTLKDAFKALFVKKDLVPTEEHLGAMAGYLIKKYSTVLDEEDIEQFLSIKKDKITPLTS